MPKSAKKPLLNFIDVFSGAGGLSCGMEMAGMRCILGVDANKHAMETFAANHAEAEVYCGDIYKLDAKTLGELLKGQDVHAVVGGPPCQGFSTVGPGNPEDERNSLFLQFVKIVKLTRPYFVVIENVTGLLAKKNEKTLEAIFIQFGRLGYRLDVQVMSAEKYGVPEKRRRTIIIGTRINDQAVFPRPSHDIAVGGKSVPARTVGDALADLKDKNGKTWNHDIEAAQISSKLELRRLKRIPEGKGIRYEKDEKAYLTPSLRLDVDWDKLPENRFRQTKYQRLDRTKPSPTIMTHRHSYYHPTEHRFLTQREAARLQSFPNNFVFKGPVSAQWTQIGNAVPPLLGKAIGEALVAMHAHAEKNDAINKKTKRTYKKVEIQDIRGRAFHYREPAATR